MPPRDTLSTTSKRPRECAYCGESLAYEGGIKAWGALYCNEQCVDDDESGVGSWDDHGEDS